MSLKSILQQTTNDLDEEIDKVNIEMEIEIIEQSHKRARENVSSEVPKMKREIATNGEASTSNKNIERQPEHPVIAPKPQHQIQPQRVPRTTVNTRECERESERKKN